MNPKNRKCSIFHVLLGKKKVENVSKKFSQNFSLDLRVHEVKKKLKKVFRNILNFFFA